MALLSLVEENGVVVVGGWVGWFLDEKLGWTSPAFFWFFGAMTGITAVGVIVAVLLHHDG